MFPALSEDERFVLTHISRWGSDGYPIKKVGSRHWTWGPIRSINGPPVLFPTKKQAVESFEKYHDSLLERYADERRDAAKD
jgi:hypothetical protein